MIIQFVVIRLILFLYVVIDGKYADAERSNCRLRSEPTKNYYKKLKHAGIIEDFEIIYNEDFCKKFLYMQFKEEFDNFNYCDGCSNCDDCNIYGMLGSNTEKEESILSELDDLFK